MLKLQQHLGTFLLSSTKITSENNLPFQVKEIVLDDIEQCQQNTHFVRNFSNDLRNNALGNFEKSPDATEIATSHTMSTIVQQFTLDDTLIPLPNDIHTSITENHHTSISISSNDESFQKLELKICELNKSVNYGSALLKKKWILFLNI